MDIPVMPHPGTDTQASPYRSRQTKETTNNLKQMNMKKQILTLLVLLMTVVTGAWADVKAPSVKPFTVPDTWQSVNEAYTAADLPAEFAACSDDEAAAWAAACTDEQAVLIYSLANCYVKYPKGSAKTTYVKMEFYGAQNNGMKIYYTVTAGTALTPDATRKVWTLDKMPAYDVELEVEYYPGMLSLGGDAIEGGTVEVVGLTDDALPAGFEKDAEGNIYVAEGTTFTVKATPEEGYHFVCWSDDETNTNPEREITMGVQDLAFTAIFAENEYDITFSEGTNPDPENPEWTATPNPAKTKQTVTVTYTGSRKVIGVKAEKKAAAPTLKDALANGATVVINYTWFDENVTTFTYTNNGGTYTGNTTGVDAGYFTNGMSMSGTTLRFTASNTDATEANVSIDFYTDTNEYYFNSKDTGFTSFTISVNGTDLTSQLKEVK